MTACTNKARGAVVAALAGALALGAAPAVALATTGDGGVQLLAAGWNTNVTVKTAQDGKGGNVSNPNEATFTVGDGKLLVPQVIESAYQTTTVDLNTYQVLYYSNKADAESNNKTSSSLVYAMGAVSNPAYWEGKSGNVTNNVGTYYVVVEDTSDGSYTNPIAFVIANRTAAQGVTVKDQLVYNGSVQAPEFVDENGKPITGTVTYQDSLGHPLTDADIKDAGDYVAIVVAADGTYNVPFTISKLDLSTASLRVSDQVISGGTSPIANRTQLFAALSINGSTTLASTLYSGGSGVLDATKVVNPSGTGVMNAGAGEYQVTVSITKDDPNVTGTATVTYSVLDTDVFTDAKTEFKYGSQKLSKTAGSESTVSVSLVDGQSFDPTRISVEYNDAVVEGEDLELSYEVQDGISWKACEASDLAKQGTYRVTVRVRPSSEFGSSVVYGGTRSFYVEVSGAEADTDDLAFFVDGKLAGDSAEVTYDGSDWLERVTTTVRDSEGNEMTEGTDYELVVTDMTSGDEVDSVVDAGTYQIKVKPLTFKFDTSTGDTLTLEVSPVDLSVIYADTDDMRFAADAETGLIPPTGTEWNGFWPTTVDNEFYVHYTGSAVEVPGVRYQVQDGDDYSYVTLDPSLYNVVSIYDEDAKKVVTEAVDAHTYTVTIALSDAAKSNYSLGATTTYTFTVKEYGRFTDVDPTQWYAEPVEKAAELGYMNGAGGTSLFMPGAQITRAELACVMFNMAGGTDAFGDQTFPNRFEDVESDAWYSQAVSWADQYDVVNGNGDGTFRPFDNATREQVACVLYNYAKAQGKDVSVDADAVLAEFPDGDQVSGWASEAVAWAAESGVMGNGGTLAPTATITRAEVAAMAVNYQPEAVA